MTSIGWHASHEQIAPSALLSFVQRAADAGFEAAMSSDHFSPWSERQGQSGFAWSWLGAALATTDLPFGIVTAPGQRYHPAITAQAIATLLEMFPRRLWVALGTGEASNEHITGDGWPDKPMRTARLREVVDILRALFAGEEVTHHGLVRVDRARLWTRPQESPRLIGAAVSPETAAWVGGWADGLITVGHDATTVGRVIEAFRTTAGDRPPVYLQVHVSWAPTDEEALAIAHDQWRSNVFAPPACWDLETPELFDEAARYVRPDDITPHVLVSADPAVHAATLHELGELGVDGIWVHHVGRDQAPFIDCYGDHVLPALRGRAS
jgi:probable non-F420 flavinoid oxidoreductase